MTSPWNEENLSLENLGLNNQEKNEKEPSYWKEKLEEEWRVDFKNQTISSALMVEKNYFALYSYLNRLKNEIEESAKLAIQNYIVAITPKGILKQYLIKLVKL